MNPTLLTVSALTYGLLLAASVLTRLLLLKSPANTTLNKVWVIIKSWWLIVTFVLGCFALAPWGLLIGFGAISVLGAAEYMRFSQLTGYRRMIFAAHVLFIAVEYLALANGRADIFQVLPIWFILATLPLFVVLIARIEQMPLIFSSIVGPILVFHFLAHLPALYLELAPENEAHALLAVFLTIFLTESNDILAFLNGKLWGKRKITPEISPNKTEAGFIGALVLTSLLAVFALPYFLEISWRLALILGFTISIFGILGDLFFSAVKRYLGTKDFSEALPGHGGILDRVDSLVLTTPVAYYILLYLKGL